MSETIYTNHPDVEKIGRAAFRDYNGRKFKVEINSSLNVSSYWDGGSRDYFVFLRLDNLETFEVPQQSAYDKKIQGAESISLVPGMVCVEHSYFQGHDMGITIHVHPENAPRFITEKTELTRNEKIVIVFTRSYKNSYGGETNCRFKEAQRSKGITLQEWCDTVELLKGKKFLNAAGAITNDGKNAIGDLSEYAIK